MTASRGLFVRQTGTAPTAIGTTPTEARLAIAGLVAAQSPGVPRNGLLFQSATQIVTASSTDMSYNIGPCHPVINRAVSEGVYLFSLTGTTNVATGNAPGTGSRFDLIYVRQHDPDKGDADNLPEVGVVQGTSSTGTPTKPYSSVPAGGYVLAEAQIFSGTTSTSGGTNVITQVWQHTATRGAPIPVLNQTDRDAMTPFNGLTVLRLDSGGQPQTYNGTTWSPLYSVLSPLAVTNYIISGTITMVPLAGKTRVDLDLTIQLNNGTSITVGTAWAAIGAIIPSTARSAAGAPKYTAVIYDFNMNIIGQSYLDTTTGIISIRNATSFTWVSGGRFFLTTSYYL